MRKLKTLTALLCLLSASSAAEQGLNGQQTQEPSPTVISRPALPLQMAQIQDEEPAKPAEADTSTLAPEFQYEMAIDGIEGKLEKLLKSVSVLKLKEDKPPPGRAGLLRRVQKDTDAFAAALKSKGYYAYKLEHRIAFDQTPVRVVFDIDPGPVYTLTAFDIAYDNPEGGALLKAPDAIGITVGGPAAAKPIVDAPTILLRKLGEAGYPLAKAKKRSAVVDHATKSMQVTLNIAEGPQVVFGETRVTGSRDVDTAYIVRVADLSPGEHFSVARIDEARRRLFSTGLFEGLEIGWDAAPNDLDGLGIHIQVTERKPRTISLGLNYSTTEGAGTDIEWLHRNLLGQDEDLTVTLKAAQLEQSLRGELGAPHIGRLDQRVSVAAELARESTDAFEEQRVLLEAGLSRPYGERWKIGGGGELSYLETQENAVTATNILVAFPFFATYDGSNDFFNPTEGYKLDFRFEPAAVTLENTDFFTTFMAGGSVYQQLGEDDDLILAARAKAGFIAGPARDQIPAGRRLFAGGGGSIRGFQFQSVGPLDSSNDPEGGRSLAEFGVELRWRLTEDIGIVPFLDGGAAFEDPVPDFTDLRFAAGLGLRYFTPVGPLRLDVATPLNPRQSDGLIEFYISLGQAF